MKKLLLFSLMAVCLAQFSCKKDDDNTPDALDANTGAIKNGSKVSGTINTTSAANVSENFDIDFHYAGGPNVYDVSNSRLDFYVFKNFNDGYAGSIDYASGNFTFGAVDTLQSKPTSWSFSVNASNGNSNGTFLFSTGTNINQLNSTITNYSYSNNTASFKVTTNGAYVGNNGKTASLTLDFNLPVSVARYRQAQ
jgi:hypothetical protein